MAKSKSNVSKTNKNARDIERRMTQLAAERSTLRKRFWISIVALVIVLGGSFVLGGLGIIDLSDFATMIITAICDGICIYFAFTNGAKLSSVKEEIGILEIELEGNRIK